MKTVFITSFHALISRNILQTSLLRELARDGIRVVLVVPDYKKSYFQEQFSASQVTVVGVSTNLSRRDIFFRKLTLALTPTRALTIKWRADFYVNRKFFPFVISSILSFFGRFSYALRMLRLLEAVLPGTSFFKDLLDQEKPDLIFLTDIQNELDVRLLKEAQAQGIRTVGMVRSWDNLTTKGFIRALPDRLVVHNEIMKDEAIQLNLMSGDHIDVVGVPHYDRYFQAMHDAELRQENQRLVFFHSFGFDAEKPLVLFTPIGDRYIRDNDLDSFVLRTLARLHCNVLVRFPPGDVVSLNIDKKQFPNIAFDDPGVSMWSGGRKLNEISRADDGLLIKELLYTQVVVTSYSTIVIDAAFFGKPTILISFDARDRSYPDSVRRYRDYEHFTAVEKSGAVKFAQSPDELMQYTLAYIKNPSRDGAERKKLAEKEAYRLDGNATERLAFVLRSFIKDKKERYAE